MDHDLYFELLNATLSRSTEHYLPNRPRQLPTFSYVLKERIRTSSMSRFLDFLKFSGQKIAG